MAWTAALYRELLGWDVQHHAGRTTLSLGRGMVAVAVPASTAAAVATCLRQIDAAGPVLAVAEERPRWMFLADPNGYVTVHDDLPHEVTVIGSGQRIPIPVADAPSALLRWIIPPSNRRSWLPTIAAILLGLRSTQRAVAAGDEQPAARRET